MIADIEGKLREPVILLAPRFSGTADEFCGADYDGSLAQGIERYDALRSLGYRVKVLGAIEKNKHTHGFWDYTQDFNEFRPGSLLRLDIRDRSGLLCALWPRDVFQKYGEVVFAGNGCLDRTKEIIAKLGLLKRYNDIRVSDLGEGGYVVRDEGVVVVSEAANRIGLEELKSVGYEVFMLPVPKKREKSDLARRTRLNQHIDTEFNLAFSRQGNPFACVNGLYYGQFRREVDRLCRSLGARLHVVPEGDETERMAVNFIKLRGGRVMLPDGCPSTAEFLGRCFGRSNVLEALVDDPRIDFSGPGGGLRCMSNVVE